MTTRGPNSSGPCKPGTAEPDDTALPGRMHCIALTSGDGGDSRFECERTLVPGRAQGGYSGPQ